MSIQLVDAVLRLRFSPVSKLVMVGLANNASDEGRCWPNQETIALYASVSERSVRDHLHELEAEGWIAVVSVGNGRGRSSEYRLNAARIKAEADASKGGSSCNQRRKMVQEKAEAAASDQPSLEPSLGTVSEPRDAQAPASKTVKPARMVELPEDELVLIRSEFPAHPDLEGAIERCRGTPGFRFGNRPAVLRRWLTSDMERLNERRNGNGTRNGAHNGRSHGPRTDDGSGWARELGISIAPGSP